MIEVHVKSDFLIYNKSDYSDWISRILDSVVFTLGQLDYLLCRDQALMEINLQYLARDTLTEIISLDCSQGTVLSGDIFISTERVAENAKTFGVSFDNELLRVMSHGLLHLMGYGDKEEEQIVQMRAKEEEKIRMFHVEH